MARIAQSCVVFLEVLDWGCITSRNVSVVSLIFLSLFLVLVCAGPDGLSPGPEIF